MTFRNTVWQGKWNWLLVAIAVLLLTILVLIFLDENQSTIERIIGVVGIGATLILIGVMHNWITVESGHIRIGYFPFYRRTLGTVKSNVLPASISSRLNTMAV